MVSVLGWGVVVGVVVLKDVVFGDIKVVGVLSFGGLVGVW